MRICQLSHVELTYNFLAPLFEALREDGHEVVASCNMDAGGRWLREYLGDDYEFHQVSVARSVTARTFTTDIVRLARYLSAERFDVLHVHSPLVSLQGRLAARLARIPIVVYQAHGFYFHEGMSALAYHGLLALERLFCRHLTDYLITVNREDYDLALRETFRPRADQVMYCPSVGIDPQRFAPPSVRTGTNEASVRQETKIPPDAIVVTFVGRLVGEKGVSELLDAFDRIARRRDDVWLVLVGDTPATERDQTSAAGIADFLRQSPVRSRVRVLGRRSDVPAVLRSTDVFVLPSHREGMPVSLLEAMATEVACIATDVRGCREAIRHGHSGLLVPPRDTQALADAMEKLAAHAPLRTRLGQEARKRVIERYAVDVVMERQKRFYRDIETDRARAGR